MKIAIPHLDYFITVKPFTPTAELKNATSYVERTGKNTVTMYLRKRASPPEISHEVIHVLQFICDTYDIDFIQEVEHVANIMQYIMARILKYEYK